MPNTSTFNLEVSFRFLKRRLKEEALGIIGERYVIRCRSEIVDSGSQIVVSRTCNCNYDEF